MTNAITVTVDPRVELMSIIFRLAGNPEHNQGRVPSYVQDVDSHFGRFRDHPVVALARKLWQAQGISFDAVMSMAVHVTDAVSLQEKVPLAPLPKSLDSRWTPETARAFLGLARKFVVEADFKGFLDKHESLYKAGVQRMQGTPVKYAHLDWFDRFFGPRKYADLAQFFPKIVAFFNDYASNVDTKLGFLKAAKDKQLQPRQDKAPKVVSMVPANGAEDVDPGLKEIVVTFDRPMRDKGWSIVTLGFQDKFPKTAGPLQYDATRRVFTMPVELQPEKEYVFGLNGGKFQSFRSAQGVPLAPIVVRFKTRVK